MVETWIWVFQLYEIEPNKAFLCHDIIMNWINYQLHVYRNTWCSIYSVGMPCMYFEDNSDAIDKISNHIVMA